MLQTYSKIENINTGKYLYFLTELNDFEASLGWLFLE